MSKQEFFEYFKNMSPMKYYEGDVKSIKAQNMIKNHNNEYIAMEKRDGEWSRAIVMENDVLLQSRSISKVTGTYGYKTEHVPHIVEELLSVYPPGSVILGEMAFEDRSKTSKDVGSILRCKPLKAIERQKENPLYFFAFDLLAYNYNIHEEKAFEERFFLLNEVTRNNQFIQIVLDGNSFNDFMGFADSIWQDKGEGIIIVRKDMKYAPGKRTAWQSLKIKKKLDVLKVKVIDFIEPNKLYEGKELDSWSYFVDLNNKPADLTKMIDYGTLTPVTKPYYYGWKNGVIVEYEERIIRVSSGISDTDREWMSTQEAQSKLTKGLYAEITGMELTKDSIRHPVFMGFKKGD